MDPHLRTYTVTDDMQTRTAARIDGRGARRAPPRHAVRAAATAALVVATAGWARAQLPPPPAGTPPAGTADVAPGAVREESDGITVRLVNVELAVAVQALARYVDRPVLVTAPTTARVTLETPQPVARGDVLRLLRGLVSSHGLEFVDDSTSGLYRVQARPGSAPGAMPGPVGPSMASGQPTGVRLFVLRLRHARAADVAATVNALYGRGAALGEPGAARGAGATLGQQLNANAVPPQPVAPPPPGAPAPAGPARSAQFAGEVTIVPDANSNALLVRSSPADYELIQAAVQELDVRPLQVLIEVIVAEVRRDRSFSFGVEIAAPEQGVKGVPHVKAEASQRGIALGDFALSVMRAGPGPDFEATLRASAARGDARILSRPVVLATNGEAAEILVGSQRPFVQVQRSLPTDAPSRDQVVQYKDVGTRLTVLPTISGDGYVSLAVTQEVNAATTETQFDAPVISTRTVQTVLLVRDSQTVVLGGLADSQREATQGGIPVLSSIPLLGGLFGRVSRQRTETEFFLFLRPRIIRTDEDAAGVTEPYRRRAGEGDR